MTIPEALIILTLVTLGGFALVYVLAMKAENMR